VKRTTEFGVLTNAEQKPSWGYGHIHGELEGLGYDVSWQTVRRVMLDHGLLPDPDKPYKTTWKMFLKSHWESIAAADFFTVEAWRMGGLQRFLVFFVLELSTRKVEIVGIHARPCETQMLQWARNLTDPEDGFRMILFGERHVRYTMPNCVAHYLTERPHRVLGHQVVEPADPMPREGPVLCRERLGGLLKTYYREAA
jgi:hypothetical protein